MDNELATTVSRKSYVFIEKSFETEQEYNMINHDFGLVWKLMMNNFQYNDQSQTFIES